MDLLRMARHMMGETDDPHEVSTGDDGVTIKFYNDETPTQYALTLPEAQAQLPKATPVEARPWVPPPTFRPDANVEPRAPVPSLASAVGSVIGGYGGLLATPAAGISAGMGALLDRPGDLKHAGGAAAAGVAHHLRTLPDQATRPLTEQDYNSPSKEAAKRGFSVDPLSGLMLDLGSDPLNFIGGASPIVDVGKVGILGAMATVGGAKKLRGAVAAVKAARVAEEALAAERAVAAATDLAALSAHVTPEVRQAIDTAFPALNKFNKRRGFLSPSKMITTLEHAPGIPDAIRDAGKQWLQNVTIDLHPEEVANTLKGEAHDVGRTVQGGRAGVDVERWAGAPAGVTPKLMQQRRPGLIKKVMEGYLGRDWYKTSGESIFFHTGDDKSLADKFGGNLAALSNDNTVGGNTTMSVKLHDQLMADVNPPRGGKYPSRQTPQVQAIYDGKVYEDWLKKGPFRQQLALGGGYADVESARAVNDIWMGEFWGFVNPDGTPKRSGFTPAQHRWMDEQTDKLIELMNQQKTGGHDNWNTGNIQAAAWTAAKIRAGKIDPADAAKDFAAYMSGHYMQTGRDFVPGGKSAHLPGLKDLPADERDDYLRRSANIFHDPQGRDIAGKQAGQLTGGSVEGPAIFFDEHGVKTEVPGRQNITAVGADFPDQGGREVARPSMQLAQANEAQYGLLTGQDAIAGTYAAHDAPATMQNMADLILKDGTLHPKSAIFQDMRVRNLIARGQVAPQPFKGGVRLLWIGDDDPDTIRAWRQFAGILDDKYGTGEIAKSQNKGFYITNPWDKPEGEAGQVYARLIKGTHLSEHPVPPSTYDLPRVGERLVKNFDKSAPNQARQLIDLDEQASKHFKIPVSQILQDLRRAIRDSGFAGVEAAAKKAGVPLAIMLPFAQYLVQYPDAGAAPAAGAPRGKAQ